MKRKRAWTVLALAALAAGAASCLRYHPRPLAPARSLDTFEARRLDSAEIRDLFARNKAASQWPPAAWDLKSLTLAAFYYHPDLDTARAQWGIASAGRITAGEWINPVLNPLLGYNSTTPRSEMTPWIPEVSLDITIETAGKRGIRISEARHLEEQARYNILSAAWAVRARLRGALLDVFAAGERARLLAEALDIRAGLVRLLEIQKDAGEVSGYDLTSARIELGKDRLAAIEADRAREEAMAALAAAVGLPRRALDGVTLSFDEVTQTSPAIPEGEVRRHAVLNRSDILAGLAEYAASDAALRLELARQYPDLHLGPDYQLDQTDSKWTIGVSLDIPILSRNRGPIAEAEARRRECGSRFLALQAQVLGELDAAIEDCRAAQKKAETAGELMADLEKAAASAEGRYAAGEISKLELLETRLELNASAQARLEALVSAQETVGRLENASQSPLDAGEWLINAAVNGTGAGKEKKG